MTKEESMERIMESAIELHREQGINFKGVDVARRAGVPKCYINFYFRGLGNLKSEVTAKEAERRRKDPAVIAEMLRRVDSEWLDACGGSLSAVKTVEYCSAGRKGNGRVAYSLFGKRCVFSGMTDTDMGGNTINSAEAVIEAILKNEGVPLEQFAAYTFFDLQTPMGYGDYSSGPYCFNRLTLQTEAGGNSNIGVADWAKEFCPWIVFQKISSFLETEKVANTDDKLSRVLREHILWSERALAQTKPPKGLLEKGKAFWHGITSTLRFGCRSYGRG